MAKLDKMVFTETIRQLKQYLNPPESKKKSLKTESKTKVNLENMTTKMIESDLLILKLNLTNTVQLSLADNDFKKWLDAIWTGLRPKYELLWVFHEVKLQPEKYRFLKPQCSAKSDS